VGVSRSVLISGTSGACGLGECVIPTGDIGILARYASAPQFGERERVLGVCCQLTVANLDTIDVAPVDHTSAREAHR
jgi:hypothetical protein